jgi:hypothetical protein
VLLDILSHRKVLAGFGDWALDFSSENTCTYSFNSKDDTLSQK